MSKDEAGFLRRVKYVVEYASLRVTAWVFQSMPEPLAVFCGRMLGRFFWLTGAKRRRIARRNVQKAMPGELTGKEITRLLKKTAIHIGLNTVEAFWAKKRLRKEDLEGRFPMEGFELLKEAVDSGRGVICFSSHIGNWQRFGAFQAVCLGGFSAPIRPATNPLIRKYMTRLRNEFQIEELSTHAGVRPMVGALRRGRLLVILIDQHARAGYTEATFFGRKAATTSVVAALGVRLNVPVFAAYSLRDGFTFRHRGYIQGPLELIRTGDRDADARANTQLFNDMVEEPIRQHPEQWFGWLYPRWKLADRLERKQKKASEQAAPSSPES